MSPQLELRSYSADIDRHSHGYSQLVLPVSGALEIEIGGRGGQVAAHRAAVIHSGEEHCFQARGRNAFLVADLPSADCERLEALPAFLPLQHPALEYAGFLARLLNSGTLGATVARSSCALLVDLLSEQNESQAAAIDRRLLLAKTYLDEQFSNPVKLEQLCAIAHLSRRQLHTLFQRQLDCSPSEYLLRLRMNNARQLLLETRLSIQAIAEQCGYLSLAAFSDRFRRHFGVAPSHFRRCH
ncbi:helix-turn-helix domain-containing protein [Marinobacterium sp. YM272]|uniref:helix-turn-helix domain-containing protein n=1 Tax=Marinobacterium sp. YM272 TaxID=3421654 RepID=UPI003D7F6D01